MRPHSSHCPACGEAVLEVITRHGEVVLCETEQDYLITDDGVIIKGWFPHYGYCTMVLVGNGIHD